VHRRSLAARAVVLALAYVVAGCSADEADFKEAAEGAIEDEVAETLALGDLDAQCEDPSDTEVDTTFSCTATTVDGDVVDFEAVIGDDNEVVVSATNVIAVGDLPDFEAQIAGLLIDQVEGISPDDIDCGGRSLVVEQGVGFICSVTDSTGDLIEATITFDDLTEGTFNVEV
jgi:hypothetical protein